MGSICWLLLCFSPHLYPAFTDFLKANPHNYDLSLFFLFLQSTPWHLGILLTTTKWLYSVLIQVYWAQIFNPQSMLPELTSSKQSQLSFWILFLFEFWGSEKKGKWKLKGEKSVPADYSQAVSPSLLCDTEVCLSTSLSVITMLPEAPVHNPAYFLCEKLRQLMGGNR